VLLVLASQQSQLHALVAAMVIGLVIGVFGHVIHSRTLIVTGILIIGLTSGYFAWVVQPH
jgi:F0F1-type ATP synthase assembly protein I